MENDENLKEIVKILKNDKAMDVREAIAGVEEKLGMMEIEEERMEELKENGMCEEEKTISNGVLRK